jgi:hypothetical protein
MPPFDLTPLIADAFFAGRLAAKNTNGDHLFAKKIFASAER